MAKTRGKSAKTVGHRVALSCLGRTASLLRCTQVHLGARQLVVLWISSEEWDRLIRLVVMPCFKGSWQLLRLTCGAGEMRPHEALAAVTGQNCWMQWPSSVRSSTQSKRRRDIKTGCVLPAPRSQIVGANKVEAAALAGSAARPADRRLRFSTNGDGYSYVEFDVWGVLAMDEDRRGRWRIVGNEWSARVHRRPPARLPARSAAARPAELSQAMCLSAG